MDNAEGGSTLSDMALSVHEEGRCRGNGSHERTSMAALTRRQSDLSVSTIWVTHLLPLIAVYQVLITIIVTIHTAGCSPLGATSDFYLQNITVTAA